MKPKAKHAQLKRKKEIRFKSVEVTNKSGTIHRVRHPAYIFLEKGNLYIYVIITHSFKVQEYIVIELAKNPNPIDKRKGYWVAEIRKDTKDKFGKKKEGWKLDEEDDAKIRDFFKNIKKDDSVD